MKGDSNIFNFEDADTRAQIAMYNHRALILEVVTLSTGQER